MTSFPFRKFLKQNGGKMPKSQYVSYLKMVSENNILTKECIKTPAHAIIYLHMPCIIKK